MTPAFAAGEALTRISTDPYTNSDAQHKTQVEPDTFTFGNTVVSAFQSGRIFGGGSSNIGWATSPDNGLTWTHGFLPATTVNATPSGPYPAASDPSVAYNAKHKVWLISYLGLLPSGAADVVASRSTDGGLTWSNPVAVDPGGSTQGQLLDKNWTVCDNTANSPHYGNCYTEYDNATLNDLEQMSTSTDGGLHWGPAKATADGSHGIGGQPLVQPNGTVVVPYVGLDSLFFAFTISSFISTDGGNTWSASTLVSEADFHNPNGGIRAGIPLPSAEIDRSGRVYVTWSDCRFDASCSASDLVLSTSTDGASWTTVRRIPLNRVGSGVDHFIPGLAVDRSTAGNSAKLALAYYYYPVANCTADTCRLNVGFVSSTNGGQTWSSAGQLAGPMNLSWLAATSQGRMVGDYISTSIAPGASSAAPVFAVAHALTGDVFDEAMYTVPEQLSNVRGGSLSSAGDQPLVHSGAGAARTARTRPATAS